MTPGALVARAAVAFALCAGCAAERPPPPRAPGLSTPSEAVPSDLDVVIRLDLARIRAALGAETFALLQGTASSAAGSLAEDEFAVAALAASDVVVIALRPELEGGGPDNVLVLRGRLSRLRVPAGPGEPWQPAVDLGGDVRRYDRRKPGGRAAPARLYAFGDEALVFVSAAEIDSVEAVIEQGRAPSTLSPPSRGVFGFAARLRSARRLVAERFPLLRATLGDASRVEGSAELTARGLSAELSLELESEARAREAADLFRSLAAALGEGTSRVGVVARATRVEAVGKFVVLRVSLEQDALRVLWVPRDE